MHFDKIKTLEMSKENSLTIVMTTVLVVLLLASQLSLASERTKSRYSFDDNYTFLETNDSESNDNALNIFSPDFLHVSLEQDLEVSPLWPISVLPVKQAENQSTPCSIRAPPQISYKHVS